MRVILVPGITGMQWCGSGMFSDFYPSRIPDLGSRIQKQQQKRGVKKNLLSYLILLPQFSQNWILFYFWNAEGKIWAAFQRIIELFTQKFVTKLLKIWVWDPGSRKNLFRIPDPGPGVKKAPDPGSGSATLPVCGGGGPREGVPGVVQGCPTGEPYPHLSQGKNFL